MYNKFFDIKLYTIYIIITCKELIFRHTWNLINRNTFYEFNAVTRFTLVFHTYLKCNNEACRDQIIEDKSDIAIVNNQIYFIASLSPFQIKTYLLGSSEASIYCPALSMLITPSKWAERFCFIVNILLFSRRERENYKFDSLKSQLFIHFWRKKEKNLTSKRKTFFVFKFKKIRKRKNPRRSSFSKLLIIDSLESHLFV